MSPEFLEDPKDSTKVLTNSDFYIDVIEFENKEAANNLISTYKSSFTAIKGRFPFC